MEGRDPKRLDGREPDGREPDSELLRQAMAAMSERHRFHLIWLVKARARSVGELVEALAWPQPLVSHHLAILFRAGLVCADRQGRRRVYRIAEPEAPRLRKLMELVGLLNVQDGPLASVGLQEAPGSILVGPLAEENEPHKTEMEDYLL